MKLWVREGGEGGARTVLLHGLGANADVWLPLVGHLQGRWLAPDLRGHGRSPHGAPYGYASFAGDVADLLGQDEEVTLVGHSMGGAVAMALATGWYGVRVRKVIAFGVKIHWGVAELEKLRALKKVTAIGIAYSGQQVDVVPRDGFDQRLDWIMTEKETFKCG